MAMHVMRETTQQPPILAAPPILERILVVAALAGFIGVIYLAIPVGLGRVLGSGPNTTLSVAATAVVAVGFPRVRSWATAIAQRLVYGARSTPYEVLTELSDRMAGSLSTNDVLVEMAQILSLGTGAAETRVWLRVGDELVPAASAPPAPEVALPSVTIVADEVPALPDAQHVLPVRHNGRLIGAITVLESPRSPLAPAELRLLDDFASQAGLALRNVSLSAELASSLEAISEQAAEIRASRRRIVDAQDAERRRVERDIHDGAQQYLVALMVQFRVARTLLRRDPPRAQAMLPDLKRIIEEALESLNELAQGIHPPILTDHGLSVALGRQRTNPAVCVAVEDENVRRYAIEVEAAVYFACLEALNNAAKHAPGSNVVVRVAEADGQLRFSVRDDGSGFDPNECRPGSGLGNMVDRVAALGGALEVTSVPSRGTMISGVIPLATNGSIQ
jgi:signal transduction histidine kinase